MGLLGRVPDHSEEVTSGTGQNAQVPNKMTVSHSLRGVERYPTRICEASSQKPQKTLMRHPLEASHITGLCQYITLTNLSVF